MLHPTSTRIPPGVLPTLLLSPLCAPLALLRWMNQPQFAPNDKSGVFRILWSAALLWLTLVLLPFGLLPTELSREALLLGIGQQALVGLAWVSSLILRVDETHWATRLGGLIYALSAGTSAALAPVVGLFLSHPGDLPLLALGLGALAAFLSFAVGLKLMSIRPLPRWEGLKPQAPLAFLLVAAALWTLVSSLLGLSLLLLAR